MNDLVMVRGVIVNVFLLLGFVSVCSLASGWMVRHRHKVSVGLIGFLFGIMAIVAMFSPVFIQSGLIVDCRAGVIGSAALLGGATMALTSLALAGLYRVSMGGAGVLPGIYEMVFAAVLGLICHIWIRRRNKRLSVSDVLLASVVVGFGTDILMFACFMENARSLIGGVGVGGFVSLLLLIPLSMALLSTFVIREQYHDELLDAVADNERRMLHSQRMAAVGQLSHRIAHSVLNALTIILGNVELVKMEVDYTGKVRPIMDNIINAVENLSSLTGELVAFSAPGSLRFQRMDLSRCLMGVEQLLARVIGTEISVVIDGARNVGVVHVDPNLIEQSIMHMAINAVEAMNGQGQLTIAVSSGNLTKAERLRLQSCVPEEERHSGSFAVLSVQDTGCGMTEEIAARIFEPFFTTKSKNENSGLGLSSVYNIVKKHNGLIDVKTRPGCGSTFRVYFPVVC